MQAACARSTVCAPESGESKIRYNCEQLCQKQAGGMQAACARSTVCAPESGVSKSVTNVSNTAKSKLEVCKPLAPDPLCAHLNQGKFKI